jgi:N-acyl-D-aspartate/D-glutamate deacylase
MRRKGRLQPGADADITVFDPRTVADRATFLQPTLAPEGIRWVFVSGVPVVEEGRVQEAARPGHAIRAGE